MKVQGSSPETTLAIAHVQKVWQETARPRLEAIDLLRGLVMVVMALDHTRDFFSNAQFSPTDLNRTNAVFFFTRWGTHFCAPVFVMLAGTAAFLYGRRATKRQLAWFLLSRGLWLVFLEYTVIHVGWAFRFDFHHFMGQVIWAIGASMVVLSGLIFLPPWLVGLLGVVLIAGHQALTGFAGEHLPELSQLWALLLRGGRVEPWPGFLMFIMYPLLPWLGVMAVGYGTGGVWLLERVQRRRRLVSMGSAMILMFVALRAVNRYGDPQPWSDQPTSLMTVLSFLNCSKYPPSLLFVLMTLGPAMLALACFDRSPGPLGRRLIVFGRVPLFYYVLHLFLIHGTAVAFACIQNADWSYLLAHPFEQPGPAPEARGYGLPVVYLVWLGIVLALYPPCRWFADVKRRRSDAWLSYL
jgi:uncharacterized membrane protein